jgi:hypothetical protein
MEGAFEPREVPGGRRLADERRPAADLERDRRAEERVLDQVAPVHVAVGQVERAQHRVNASGAADRRAAEDFQELVGRAVVGIDEHPPEERRELRAGRRHAVQLAHQLDRDRELQRRGRRETGTRVPGGPGSGAESPGRTGRRSRGSGGRASGRFSRALHPRWPRRAGIGPEYGAPPCGRPNTGPTSVDACRPRPSIALTRIVTSRCGSVTTSANRGRVTVFVATSLPSTRTRTSLVPFETRPSIRPNETSRGAGA